MPRVDRSGRYGTPPPPPPPPHNDTPPEETLLWMIVMFIGSVVIDFIGLLTYLIPGLGEFVDLCWAPISASVVHNMYGSTFFSVMNLVEELAPGIDIIPTATIAWVYFFVVSGKIFRAVGRSR